MNIDDIIDEEPKESPDLIGVTLPRSGWMMIASILMLPIMKDVREMNEKEWKDTDEEEHYLRQVLTKILPSLLEAAGPGPQIEEDFPDVQRLRRQAEIIWSEFGESPSDEHWDLARQATLNLTQLLRENGIDPEETENFEVRVERVDE